jgi:hypothetical protein
LQRGAFVVVVVVVVEVLVIVVEVDVVVVEVDVDVVEDVATVVKDVATVVEVEVTIAGVKVKVEVAVAVASIVAAAVVDSGVVMETLVDAEMSFLAYLLLLKVHIFSLDGVVSRVGAKSCTVVDCSIGASGAVTSALETLSAAVTVSNAGGSVG